MTLQDTITRIDAWLGSVSGAFAQKQVDYYATNGRYWQGLISHSVIPAHTDAANGDLAADRRTDKPGYQDSSWLDFYPEMDGIPVPCAVAVDQYTSPQGSGVYVRRYFKHNGDLYVSVKNFFGPHASAEQAWTVVP